MAQMRKTPKGQSPLGPGKFIGTNEATKAKEMKRIREGKPTYTTSKPSTVQQVAKRFGITAREARDIATAVGSAAQAIRKSPQEGMPVKKIVKDVAKQVKEVGTAAKTGKKGTTATVLSPNKKSQANRKVAGDKGFVQYNVKNSKKR
jgi:hypothetical protein